MVRTRTGFTEVYARMLISDFNPHHVSYTQHIVFLSYLPNKLDIPSSRTKYGTGSKMFHSGLCTRSACLSVTLTVKLATQLLHVAHCHVMINIYAK